MRKNQKRLIQIIILLAACNALVLVCMKFDIAPFTHAPVLELSGGGTVHLRQGDEYSEPGFRAVSYRGVDLTDKVKVESDDIREGEPILSVGRHYITYSVRRGLRTTTVKRCVSVEYAPPLSEYDPNYGHEIPVFMYHYVYDEADPPDELNNNYISTDDLRSHLEYLVDNGYYFPTWRELRYYVTGLIDLPVKSCVLTFDDGSASFLENGLPLLEEYDVRATSFVIGSKNGKEIIENFGNAEHVSFQSHSYDMHRPGGYIGHGGVMTALSVEDARADLEKSIGLLGSCDAFAYPFGDTNDTAYEAVRLAGFNCAVTTDEGSCYPGCDPLMLPRRRVSIGLSQEGFAAMLPTEAE